MIAMKARSVTTVIVLLLVAVPAAAQSLPTTRGLHPLEADIPGVGSVLYAISVPDGYSAATPAPLVLVLHPGGQRPRYYGAQFARMVVEPALRSLKPILIAPDCPSRAWSDAACERAALALMDQAMRAYAIDRARVLVVGYSMGGRGTWHMAAKHPDRFTAAIPMAASTGNLAADELGRQPTYVIHSREDEVVPFDPAEEMVRELKKLKRDVEFEALDELTHFDMVSYVDALRRAGRWVAARWKD
jgi:predicted peptidase